MAANQNKQRMPPAYDKPKPLKISQLDNITAKQPIIIPQFDRGIKPTTTSDYNQNIQRDFAPVYGCPVSFFFDKIKIIKKINQNYTQTRMFLNVILNCTTHREKSMKF